MKETAAAATEGEVRGGLPGGQEEEEEDDLNRIKIRLTQIGFRDQGSKEKSEEDRDLKVKMFYLHIKTILME